MCSTYAPEVEIFVFIRSMSLWGVLRDATGFDRGNKIQFKGGLVVVTRT